MGGKSLTVVKKRGASKALAPLGGGEEAEENGGDAPRDKKGSAATAVWGIVQAYAIVALVLTIYNSVYGAKVNHSVPDEVEVRASSSARVVS